MKPGFLFIIRSDPRTSRRPAEALRIATGLAVWEEIDVSIYLSEAATALLAEDLAECQDAGVVERCRPLLAEKNIRVGCDPTAPASCAVERLDRKQLAAWTSAARYLAAF